MNRIPNTWSPHMTVHEIALALTERWYEAYPRYRRHHVGLMARAQAVTRYDRIINGERR